MKITPSFALILALAAPAFSQCKTWDHLEGQHSGVKQSMAVAVQDPQKWAEVWRQHDASTPAPEVDFSKESVVAVFAGRTQTAGVKVTIVVQQDPLDSNRLNVFYRETGGNKAGFAAQVISEPYAIVKVPRAATIDIERDGQVRVPEKREAPAAPKRDDRKVKALIDSIKVDTLSFDAN